MSKRRKCEFLDASKDFDQAQLVRHAVPICWDQCCLCQEDTSERLVCPMNNNGPHKGVGYTSLAEDLQLFDEFGILPDNIQLESMNDGCGLEQTFINREAKYHKSCRNKYDKTKAKRHIKKRKMDSEAETSGEKLKTRSSFNKVSNQHTCFFCNKEDSENNFVNTQTTGIHEKVFAAALKLSDTKLLAKLSEGDMFARDAKYHKICLTGLNNRVRAFDRKKAREQKSDDDLFYGVVVNEIIHYIKDRYETSDSLPVFKLADIVKLTIQRMNDFGVEDAEHKVHSTRLKDKILTYIPDLQAHKKGKDILLVFEDTPGEAIFYSCKNSAEEEGMILSRAAGLIRNRLFDEFPKFTGSFTHDFPERSIPMTLFTLVRMLLEGCQIDTERSPNSCKAALSISQLIRFNSIKRERKEAVKEIRHHPDRETPLPLYIGLMLHAETRKRDLVDKLSKLGRCVSYSRVQELSATVTELLCGQYAEEKIVCPPGLQAEIFTTSAIANIDHNPSSATSTKAFHGTGISLIQHPDVEISSRSYINTSLHQASKGPACHLPESYTDVPPMLGKKAESPLAVINVNNNDNLLHPVEESSEWLHELSHAIIANKPECSVIPWSAYYANLQLVQRPKCTSFLLPLLNEYVQTPAMVRHTFDIIKLACNKLNPDQPIVVTCDQPVYAVAKQVQWLLPTQYGEDHVIVMMGGLHIEMAMLHVIGDWLRGSGLDEILVKADVTTSGRAESSILGNHVKRSRYVHQVTVASLFILLRKAWESHKDTSLEKLEFSEWVAKQTDESVQFLYWYQVVVLETILLMFVRSIREANFIMFMDALQQICPWMFALDHVHYARWLPVFVKSLKELKTRHPSVYKEFMQGKFVTQKSHRPFSSLSDDQVHEQNNRNVKHDGGAVDILDNPSALMKWMISGPEIARMVTEFEEECGINGNVEEGFHHEDTKSFQKHFEKHIRNVVEIFEEEGNPYQEGNTLMSLIDKNVLEGKAVESVKIAAKIGSDQYQTYVQERLEKSKVSIHDVIRKNKLHLFHQPNSPSTGNAKQKVSALTQDCHLFSRLFIACQSQEGDLEDFFSHENHSYPPSLSEFGKLRKGTKSEIMECLKECGSPEYAEPDYTAVLIDGPAVVHMATPGKAVNFSYTAKMSLNQQL